MIRFDVPRVLHVMVARGADGFGVAVMHGEEAIAFLSPQDAMTKGEELIRYAKLARKPGSLPG